MNIRTGPPPAVTDARHAGTFGFASYRAALAEPGAAGMTPAAAATSPAVVFLFSWWLLLCAIVLAFSAIRRKAFWFALRVVVCATLGGLLLNGLVLLFPSMSLDETFAVTHAGSDERLFVWLGWLAVTFLGPHLLPLIGWVIGMAVGLIWAFMKLRARTVDVPVDQAWPPQ